jgi:hypothetical protein
MSRPSSRSGLASGWSRRLKDRAPASDAGARATHLNRQAALGAA